MIRNLDFVFMIDMFLRLRFYSRVITRTIFSIKMLFRVQVFQGPGFLGYRFFRVQVFQGPGPGFTRSLSLIVVLSLIFSKESNKVPNGVHR